MNKSILSDMKSEIASIKVTSIVTGHIDEINDRIKCVNVNPSADTILNAIESVEKLQVKLSMVINKCQAINESLIKLYKSN